MQQRYYDPVAGRFLGVDPAVTDANTGGSFNRYNYANNNPYLFTDPDGKCGLREGLGCYTTVFPEGPSDSYGGGVTRLNLLQVSLIPHISLATVILIKRLSN